MRAKLPSYATAQQQNPARLQEHDTMVEHSNGFASAASGQNASGCYVCSVKGSEAYIELPIVGTTEELRTTVGKFMASFEAHWILAELQKGFRLLDPFMRNLPTI